MTEADNQQKIILRGREITLRDLQTTMQGAYALIVYKLLCCIANNECTIAPPEHGGTVFVRKSPDEWANELEIYRGRGSPRKMAKPTVYCAFRALFLNGIVTYISTRARVRAYTICESNLVHRITERTGIKFEEV
jgi:hypothetical protein